VLLYGVVSRSDLRALRDLIEEARIVLNKEHLSSKGIHARKLIESAVEQADAMLANPTSAEERTPDANRHKE
jgi:hypothetical protein